MLTFLKIKNIALIDDLTVEFGRGLNLLTGETGSGKSIIVDSLGALAGNRVSNDLIKDGRQSASIEGLFDLAFSGEVRAILDESGVEIDDSKEPELIIRRELSLSGKNRIFINGQLATQNLLKRIGTFLVDIHGQGEQASIYDVATHIEILDEFAAVGKEREKVAAAFQAMSEVRLELAAVENDSADKLRLIDMLRFQIDEIRTADLSAGEDLELNEEKLRLNNIEKLTTLSTEAFDLLYDNANSTAVTLEKSERKIAELMEFESKFGEYADGIYTARAVIDDLAASLRDFRARLEFSPERLNDIEDRLADITRLKRKYGDSVESVLEHLRLSEERLLGIETSELREQELQKKLLELREEYVRLAGVLHDKRKIAANRFEKQVEQNLSAVALEKGRFEVRIDVCDTDDSAFTENGFDDLEFFFSANPGEPVKPIAKVASGGEASRLMLVLKTTAKGREKRKTAVFDEIDVGIGGRVAEAVGRKLKSLSVTQQVLCVTHQPQIASLADQHFVVEKETIRGKTIVRIRELSSSEQIEEIARMLAGEQITDQARDNARAMLASAK